MSDRLDSREITFLIGCNIAKIRKKRGMTQKQLAETINISKNYLNAVERGAKSPPIKLMAGIAKALDISIQLLYKDDID